MVGSYRCRRRRRRGIGVQATTDKYKITWISITYTNYFYILFELPCDIGN